MTSYVNTLRQMATIQCDIAENAVNYLDKNATVFATIDVEAKIVVFPPLMLIRAQLIQLDVAEIRLLLPLLRELIKFDRHAIEYMGDPDLLRAAALELSGAAQDSARGIVTALESRVDPAYFRTYDSWQGETADAYRRIAELQPENLKALLTPINTISDVLHSVAQGIEDFYVALAGAAISLAKVVVDLVVAIIGAATAGTGIGIAIAALGVVGAVMDIGTALIAVGTVFLQSQHDNEDQLVKLGPSLPGEWRKPPVGDGPPGS
ncbi:MAG: hypothetical protein JWR04_609 [Rhodoglobus sp.]|nr:hypothetical protein [Rhodoglobus sp.]